MRVKCTKYERFLKGEDKELKMNIVEPNPIGVFEGEVIDTVVLPCPNFYAKDRVAPYFVVLLDDNTFEQWPIMECTKVDEYYRD